LITGKVEKVAVDYSTTLGGNYMAMAIGKGGLKSDINVTPLIDVLLVLIIIFMVITPMIPKGLDAAIPQPAQQDPIQPKESIDSAVVVSIDAHENLKINWESVNKADLGARLADTFKTRNEKNMFVAGDSGLGFESVVDVIDIARGAGVDKIGLVTEKIQSGN
jgi:biopolymer transport protein TolR